MRTQRVRVITCAVATTTVLSTVALQAPANADPTTKTRAAEAATLFTSSFEPSEQAPTWTDTTDTDPAGLKRASGVDGALTTGIPGSVTGTVDQVTASGENAGSNEVKENLFDGDPNSKWLTFEGTGWVAFHLSQPAVVVRYALTSANDHSERDPADWTLKGSADGTSWVPLDAQTGQSFAGRFTTRQYEFSNSTAYPYYRLDITRNGSGGIVQLAEAQLATADTTPPPPGDMRASVGNGPASSPTAKTGAGFTGLRALRISGRHLPEGRAYAYDKVFEVDVPVTATTELSYLIFPELLDNDLRYPSTYVSVDLAFSDGTYLSDLGAVDQHGAGLSPRGQGDSKTLYTAQWNAKRSTIGAVAAGKTVKRILVGYDGPSGPTGFRAWVDDLKIANPGPAPKLKPSDHVLTTRGTNSTGSFSRGNNYPATAVPHGFNFWTPMTNAGSTSWLYEYAKANNADNLPTLQAFALSHETSPWMGDRQTFQVMPSAATGVPDAGRTARALAFRHDEEVARPYTYGVTFTNGLKTELAPTDHAAIFRFTFPGDTGSLIFDNVNNESALTIDAASGVVTGYTDNRSGLSTGATRMFVYATVDRPITASGPLTSGNRVSTGYTQFELGTDKTVTMRVATSLISVEQAKHNLELEIAPDDSFESVRDAAQRLWDKELSVIEVEGATADQLTTLYSNLYRLMLYPNSGYENVATRAAPVYKHAVQSATSTPASTPTTTGAPVVDGKVYVNNGFWDTYRTTWPAYTLLKPTMAGELIDGFVQQYRDGGWISRWSSPGYANLMVGTSSDVAFADAYLKGVKNFDVEAAYAAAVKNATVTPPNGNVGRKGLDSSLFLGYTAKGSTGEAMSWAMDGYINDFGIANLAAKLAEETKDPAAKQRYQEEADYFRDRALDYVNMFDPGVGFFQGRTATGQWGESPETFEPRSWGGEFTETSAWNMAFHVPQDGNGLANLYGGTLPDGTSGLAKKLDEFFATPETAGFPGGYGGTIHEMIEARDVRMGQYGHSNQPSHHIIYMYDYAGQPWKTQAKVREALSRLYLGSEIGQGYPGDEDNGEMSAWQVFGALGFYPLQMGSPNYAVGSPLFTKATVRLENGKKLVVKAPNNSPTNVYVQRLKVNGKSYDKTYLPHSLIAQGGALEFTMGAKPSTWGTGAKAAPLSLTTGSAVATPNHDLTTSEGTTVEDGTDARRLVDNLSSTEVTLGGASQTVSLLPSTGSERVTQYTLTSSTAAAGDPTGWVLEGSYDGTAWTTIDTRSEQVFSDRRQSRPFTVSKSGRFARYRLTITGTAGGGNPALSEIQLLGQPDPACTTTITGEHSGSMDLTSGVTCLAPGAKVNGSVSVRSGASLFAVKATITGALATAGAGDVVLLDSAVKGSMAISGVTGELSVEHSTIGGAVAVLANQTTPLPPLLSATEVAGPMSCAVNTPSPVNNGLKNTVHGGAVGQCHGL
jgi:predicted alpha-1,2-mannosidase